jgi:hypothetical protein
MWQIIWVVRRDKRAVQKAFALPDKQQASTRPIGLDLARLWRKITPQADQKDLVIRTEGGPSRNACTLVRGAANVSAS